MTPELSSYKDLFQKLEYDLVRFSKTNHIYELLDCFMTLNAIPEWIINSSEVDMVSKEIIQIKLQIMKGQNFDFNEEFLSESIDQKLRLVRLVCNHAKHKTDSPLIPKIERIYDATFPLILPAKFGYIISIGKHRVDAETLIKELKNFWKDLLGLN